MAIHLLRAGRIPWHTSSPDSTLVSFQVGWFQAEDGSVNVMNVPDGAETWFPANHHQQDKATYRLAISVPGEWYVVGPGSLASMSQEGGRTRYVYETNRPTTTTSAVLHIDKYEIVEMAPVDGVKPRVFYRKRPVMISSRSSPSARGATSSF